MLYGNSAQSDATTGAPPERLRVNEDARLLKDFGDRLTTYVELHDRAESELPPLGKTDDPARIDAHQEALATRIRAARAAAKPGDVFAEPVRAWFRRTIARELKAPGGGALRRAILETESNPAHITHTVNALYPDSLPVSTIPPALLLAFPRTPEEVEFRFVGRDLVLRDTHANLIIDVVHHAIP
jgi:hypothetical protein